MEQLSDKKIPLTRIQKLIGRLMLKSKQHQPGSFLECRANLTELLDFRKPYCKQTGLRITTNDFFFCAISRAIKKFPFRIQTIRTDNVHEFQASWSVWDCWPRRRGLKEIRVIED